MKKSKLIKTFIWVILMCVTVIVSHIDIHMTIGKALTYCVLVSVLYCLLIWLKES
jgi:hypothetical protein